MAIPRRNLLRVALVGFVLAVAILWQIGCSFAPTAPTRFQRYLWQLPSTLAQCAPNTANAPSEHERGAEPRVVLAGTELTTSLVSVTQGRETVMTYWQNGYQALFVKEGSFYALCLWWRA